MAMIPERRSMESSMRSPRRFGAALASVGVGRVELLARGGWHPPPPASAGTRVIVVGSTGGRVGKSTVAAHLAVAIANLGAPVIAVDLDLRTPALHGILGVERPALGWQGLLDDEIQNLESSLTSTSVRNLHLVAGGTRQGLGRPGAPGLDGEQRRLLLRQLRALEAEVVIIDLCATSYDDLADFFALAETGLLVTSPDESSLAASLDFLTHAARVAPSPAVRAEAPATEATAAARGFVGRLVGNQAATAEQIEIIHAFSRLARARLAIDLPVVGCVRAQDRLGPLGPPTRGPLRDIGLDRNGRTFLRMAEYLLHDLSPAVPSVDTPPSTGESNASADAGDQGLMRQLDRYRRKYLRHEVDWAAALRIGERAIDVRVVDMSISGAALEVATELEIGAGGTLCFVQLPGQPELPVEVKSLQESIRRAGVAFTGPDEERQRLVAIAEARPDAVPVPADEVPTAGSRMAPDEAP
jgi:MinD-like ATPase involved in chromosome partitioning or flagellar assembly